MIEFWEQGVNPITMFKESYVKSGKTIKATPVKYIKVDEFDSSLYIETKDLMAKYNIGSNMLGIKMRNAGFEKVNCFNRKWVLREFEKTLIK